MNCPFKHPLPRPHSPLTSAQHLEDSDLHAVVMSKRQFKSQASSSRAAGTGGFGGFSGFGNTSTQSTLSYLTQPPNLSVISDPNVVVSFKNLSKKDRATKARGLEDLRTYVQAHPYENGGGVEEAVLEVWVSTYVSLSLSWY